MATGVHALITGDYGNKPVADQNWPEGTLAIANLKTRVGWWEGPPFGGGQFTFLYRGDTKAFNEALKLLDQLKAPAVELHVHAGPHEDFWLVERGEKKEGAKRRDPRIDWSFTVWTPENFHHLYNNPTGLFASDRPDFRQPLPAPKIDVYLGDGLIDWKDVKVPEKVRLVGIPEDVLKRRAPRLSVQVYDMITSKPITGAQIKLVTYDMQGQKDAGEGTTDADGAAEFASLEPGNYDVRLAAEGYAPRSLGWDPLAIGDHRITTVQLSPEITVSGRVVDSKDQPIAKAEVHTFVVLGFDGRGYSMPERPHVATDDGGKFQLKLPRGYVQLSARAKDLYHSWTDVLPVGGRAATASQTEPIVIRMARTTSVTVKLADSQGKTLANQSFALQPTGDAIGKWSGGGTTDAKGRAVVEGVPPGEYRVTDRGYPEKQSEVVRVDEGKAVEVKATW
jgi:hypothetical protein